MLGQALKAGSGLACPAPRSAPLHLQRRSRLAPLPRWEHAKSAWRHQERHLQPLEAAQTSEGRVQTSGWRGERGEEEDSVFSWTRQW